MRRHTSQPSRPGIITSSSTIDGRPDSKSESASSPLYATDTGYPFASRYCRTMSALSWLSSTTRTVGRDASGICDLVSEDMERGQVASQPPPCPHLPSDHLRQSRRRPGEREPESVRIA